MVSATKTSGGKAWYGYAADNKRVHVNTPRSLEQWTFYGAKGEKLGVFGLTNPVCAFSICSSQFAFAAEGISVSFAGKLIQDSYAAGSQPVIADRLETNRASGARFYPYGDEITSTTNNREKFGTYTRDSYTGLDYADHRFYASSYRRFTIPDPDRERAKGDDSVSWNRYAYVGGDPVNRFDKTGLDWTNNYDYEAWTESYYTGGAISPGQEISAQSEAEYSANVTDVFNSSSSNSNSSSSSSSNPGNTANPVPKCEEQILSAVKTVRIKFHVCRCHK